MMNFVMANGMNCGKVRCEIGWNWRPGPLCDYDLWCVLSGSGEMQLNGVKHPLRKGACFLLHPGDQPVASQDLDDRLTVIFIHFQVLSFGPDRTVLSPELLKDRVVYMEDLAELEGLLHQALETRYRDDAWTEQEFDCTMKSVLIQLYRAQDRPEAASALSRKQRQAVSRVMRRVQEEGGRRIPHEELAELVGLTPAYMSKIFKLYTGTSLKEYVTKVRLQRAKHLLSETTMNVSQVSDALGYASVFLFSKQFKQHFGTPPSSFMQRADPPQSTR
ncbi:AraC family transcriptional regulator [Paenibacillus sp. HJGM_3]|uniref:AraC family transcriptional regulator n=1 Tax=Paenibacillus sp. HJGM_3 TaxID=3379816 RepID=UPI0038581D28